ncbi:MAG: alpha/beta hydrolase-fold protein [Ferruginibacter sp.]
MRLKKSSLISVAGIGILFLSLTLDASSLFAGDVTIIDSRHYSNVFGEVRNFRIFLPPGYYENPAKRYPVIYFLHGWSQRYFGSSGNVYSEYDKGEENHGDNIANFVKINEVIVVKSDGYDRGAQEKYYVAPYNIEPVETYRQFPIYFPELINYIDENYKTIKDRGHRAITGLSMGGFTSYWIGGKYPDLFSAIGSFCGSTEFIVGPRDFPVTYRHSDMYKNYGGVKVRLNTGDNDFIRGYNADLTRIWEEVMDNFECKIYNSDHNTCGLGEMFESFMNTFRNPIAKPQKWSHIDVYPDFSVWGYEVSSNRTVPGLTIIENVDNRGFKCSVREFLPDGELMPFVEVAVLTPAVYEKNQFYIINDVDTKSLKTLQRTIRSDNSGRLKITISGSIHEIGINKKTDKPNICIASVIIENMSWAISRKDVLISIHLINKGMSTGKYVSAALSSVKNNTGVSNGETAFGDITINAIKTCKIPYIFKVNTDGIEIVKFKLTIHDLQRNEWTEYFEIPIKKDLPEFKDFVIADGRTFTVAQGGIKSETIFLGHGNGDGRANPGESIVVLVKDQNKYWRTNLHFSDKFLNPFGANIRFADKWSDFDHVGESEKYNVPLISSDCPDNHQIELFAEYWLPDYPLHIRKQVKINFKVNGKDSTPPQIGWFEVLGDNCILVKLYDGSKIKSVKVIFTKKNNPKEKFEIDLQDDETTGGKAGSANVFSNIVPEKKFGFYNVAIEAIDTFGNKVTEEMSASHILH